MVRVHLTTTFPLDEWELKVCMRKDEGRDAGIVPEEEVSRNGRQILFVKRAC